MIPAAVPPVPQARVAGCVTHACHVRTLHKRRRREWALENPWHHKWNGLSSGDRAWLRRTAWCESTNNPHANTGNGFYGLVQFTLPTAKAAGFKARPDLTSWHQQGVRAVWWMHEAGTGQWPVCG